MTNDELLARAEKAEAELAKVKGLMAKMAAEQIGEAHHAAIRAARMAALVEELKPQKGET